MKTVIIILVVLYLIGILTLIYEFINAPIVNDNYNEWDHKSKDSEENPDGRE